MSSTQSLDLTAGVLGTQVPQESPSIKWKDGHKTILPAIYDEKKQNICDKVDIPFIQYMARLPTSQRSSTHVIHLEYGAQTIRDISEIVEEALSLNKSVKISGVPHNAPKKELSSTYLDVTFGISPFRPVYAHGTRWGRGLAC